MNWTEIILCLFGAGGLISTIITLIANKKERKAKAESVEVNNLVTIVNTLTERINNIETKSDEDREQAHKYITTLRGEVVALRSQVNTLERVTLQAYRCQYPENIMNCPVVKAYEEKHCNSCHSKGMVAEA